MKALKAACVQKPELGQTVKLDFDLYPTATSSVSSTKTGTDANIELATPTSTSPDPAISILVASLQASFSAQAASESAAAASKGSHDRSVRTKVGVGVGVGVGGFLAISAVACLIWTRYRSVRRKEAEENNARTHPEMELQNNSKVQNQFFARQRAELGNDANIVEVDGQPKKENFMLDGSTIFEVPGRSSAVITAAAPSSTPTPSATATATTIDTTGHESSPRWEILR